MRVLKTKSIDSSDGLTFTTLTPSHITTKPYAILSHVWSDDEVLYTDILNNQAEQRTGFLKIKDACHQALAHGLDYLWVDTCCIDRTSSAELSEAVNSNFDWYRNTAICYAYLGDYKGDYTSQPDGLLDSIWFTRGWTLQELIAPPEIIFFASGWKELGTKTSLCDDLSKFTSIDPDILLGRRDVRAASIAQRMFWASKRKTTLPEDMAYCLFGLFGVYTTILYGEGLERAFARLQQEILNDPKDALDHSLFAWVDPHAPDDKEYGMLAPTPSCFARSRDLVPYVAEEDRTPARWTTRGLNIQLRIHRYVYVGDVTDPTTFTGIIDCPPTDFEEGCYMKIYLKRTGPDQFSRVRASQVIRFRQEEATGGEPYGNHTLKEIWVRESPRGVAKETEQLYLYHYLTVEVSLPGGMYRLSDVVMFPDGNKYGPLPKGGGRIDKRFLVRRGTGKVTMAMLLTRRDGKRLMVTFGSWRPLQLGFDAQELEDAVGRPSHPRNHLPEAEYIQSMFNPQPLGAVGAGPAASTKLPNHRITVEVTGTQIGQARSKTYQVRVLVVPEESIMLPDEPPPEFTEKPILEVEDRSVGDAQSEKSEKGESSRSKLRSFLGRG